MLVLLCLPHFGSFSSKLAELLFSDELKGRNPKLPCSWLSERAHAVFPSGAVAGLLQGMRSVLRVLLVGWSLCDEENGAGSSAAGEELLWGPPRTEAALCELAQ